MIDEAQRAEVLAWINSTREKWNVGAALTEIPPDRTPGESASACCPVAKALGVSSGYEAAVMVNDADDLQYQVIPEFVQEFMRDHDKRTRPSL